MGKTSMACTTAVRYADEGKRTLIVTTDPASNLADVFEQPIGHQITPIDGVPNLWAMEIDPDRATQEYIDRAMAPIRAAFPPQMVQVMEEQMSGPCTAEVAAFDRFTDFLDVPAANGTDLRRRDLRHRAHRPHPAPAGTAGRVEPVDRRGQRRAAARPASARRRRSRTPSTSTSARWPRCATRAHTTFIFVLHPEAIAIKETQRAIGELGKLGIHTHQLIVNGIIPPRGRSQPALRRPRRDAGPLPGADRAASCRCPPAAHVPAAGRDQGRRAPARGGRRSSSTAHRTARLIGQQREHVATDRPPLPIRRRCPARVLAQRPPPHDLLRRQGRRRQDRRLVRHRRLAGAARATRRCC